MKRLYGFLCTIILIVGVKGQNNLILPPSNIDLVYDNLNIIAQNDTIVELNIPSSISGISVSGCATLSHTSNSLVRITLQDEYNTELLVYEVYPLLADSSIVVFDNMAFETAVLDNVTATQLNITIMNATLQLDKINLSTEPVLFAPSLQDSVLNSTSSYYINKLNEELEEREMPWVAGETSVSQLTFEEKKALFGGEVPNLGGFEYYVGGIFVMPDYECTSVDNTISTLSETDAPTSYASEWDWRNRHGKNWMTSVKNQGLCGSCWAFSTIGAVEAYANLYYNDLLNLDLSEQELVSCNDLNNGCAGGLIDEALDYIIDKGVIDEQSYAYIEADGNCDDKPINSDERIKIGSYRTFVNKNERSLKLLLMESPMTVGFSTWRHAVVLAGYKVLKAGDCVYNRSKKRIVLKENSALIGTTAWLIKNSYGESWGDEGYGYVALGVSWMVDKNTCSIRGGVVSPNYDDSDIIVEDADNDGYYFWGIGEKPENVPSWAQEKADGDDSNPLYGALDAFGNLENISLASYPDIVINADTVWNEDNYVYNNVRIVSGGKLTVSADVKKYSTSSIIVESGGELVIDGGTITHGNTIVKDNGTMSIIGGGEIRLSDSNNFKVEQGGVFNQEFGKVKIID